MTKPTLEREVSAWILIRHGDGADGVVDEILGVYLNYAAAQARIEVEIAKPENRPWWGYDTLPTWVYMEGK